LKILNRFAIAFVCSFMCLSMLINAENIVVGGNTAGPSTLDPAEAWDNTSTIYLSNIFNRLVELDRDSLKIKPSLASGWDSNSDGTVWVFRLRRGVKFHDGTPFDADAVVFTFKRQMEETYKYGEFVLFREIFSFLKSVEKIGKYKVRFILKKSFFLFPASLSAACASIISPSALKEKKEKFRYEPVGTGPYKMKEWKKGKKIVLESFDGYWKGKPGIDKYVAIIEPNMDKLFELFRKQKVDLLMSFSISRMVILKSYKWVGYDYSSSLSTNYIAFNMKNKYLKKLGIRKAINFLWNKDILKLVYQNHVEPMCSLFPKGMSGYDCNFDKYPMSIEKAAAILKKEGLNKGFELKFLVKRDSNLELPTAKKFAQNLKKVGIRIKIVNVGMDEYFLKISKGEYDLTFSSWIADYPDPYSIIQPLFSKEIQQKGVANFSSGNNRDIVEMIEKARTMRNSSERENLYTKLNKIVVERALFVPLYQDISLIIYNKRIGKVKQDKLGDIDLFRLGKQ